MHSVAHDAARRFLELARILVSSCSMTIGCQSFAAKRWLQKQPTPSSFLTGSPLVEARSAGEGRGLGLYANRTIAQFAQIVSEVPMVLMRPGDDLPELYQQFSGILSEENRRRYLSLSFHENPERDALLKDKLLKRGFGEEGLETMAQVAGIMQTNAFNVDLRDGQGSGHRALFPTIARINHSCAPNAHVCFYPPSTDQARGRMAVRALKELSSGEEILISYFSILLPRAERQAKARKWGFDCKCEVCGESLAGHEAGEKQRQKLREFNAQVNRLMDSDRASLKYIDSIVAKGGALLAQIEHKPELHPALPDLHDGLAMLSAKALVVQKMDSQREQVLSFLEQSAVWEAQITGADSPATERRLLKLRQFATRNESASRPIAVKDSDDNVCIQWRA